MSDIVQLAIITSVTTVVMGLMAIATMLVTHTLSMKKLEHVEHLANSTLTAQMKRSDKQDDIISAQLPAETNPKKVLPVPESDQ